MVCIQAQYMSASKLWRRSHAQQSSMWIGAAMSEGLARLLITGHGTQVCVYNVESFTG